MIFILVDLRVQWERIPFYMQALYCTSSIISIIFSLFTIHSYAKDAFKFLNMCINTKRKVNRNELYNLFIVSIIIKNFQAMHLESELTSLTKINLVK